MRNQTFKVLIVSGRHYTDKSGAFACSAPPVASDVNPPEERPSVSAATAGRRGAQPLGWGSLRRCN